ncbi:hypothetical protein ACHWQZ_G019025 [Mnemiopsis leidyi]
MAELPSLHSCLYMRAENERITAKYKRLKARYTELVSQTSNRPVNFSATTRAPTGLVDHKGTQTVVSRDTHDINQDKQSTKLLQTHALLVRKYEKELATNTENSETISNLKISNSKLESELRSAREKLHKTSVALEKYKQQTEKKLQNDKEEIFKLTAERDSIRYEHERLKSEMRGIDKNFFDEIEDLKYALQESAKLNKIYEKTLQSVCRKSKVDYQEALLNVVSKCRKSGNEKGP